MTSTSAFGVGRREGHDSSPFYRLRLHDGAVTTATGERYTGELGWANQLYLQDARSMYHIPDNSVGLAFTSPPYNVGKEYDENLDLAEYLDLLSAVASEVYRVLVPGGRYVVNLANLGRKPYIHLTGHVAGNMVATGWLMAGEIIWQKAKGAGGNCAWGSWRNAKAPRLRDIHEYLLVFCKGDFSRPDKGVSTLESEEFMTSTLSVWQIPPESAKRVGHPAPFPVALAERVIRLYSYEGDVVLDPFMGAGTTCVAAQQAGRHYVGYEIEESYIALAKTRVNNGRERGSRSKSARGDKASSPE